jgi:hypothetical protein
VTRALQPRLERASLRCKIEKITVGRLAGSIRGDAGRSFVVSLTQS